METLIHRIRAAIALGVDQAKIIEHFLPEDGVTRETLFLAYQAAIILDSPSMAKSLR